MSTGKITIKAVWDHLEEIFLIPALAASVIIVFAQVIARYILNNSIPWSEELARYLFVWISWLGTAYAAKNKSHLRIQLLKEKLILELVVYAVWIVFAVFLAIRGFMILKTILTFSQKSPALGLPMQYVYAAVPVGCCLMVVRLLENLVKMIRDTENFFEIGGAAE